MNHKVHRFIFASALILSFLTVSLPLGLAQTAAVQAVDATYAAGLAKIEEKLEARRKELGIPGMSLVIVKDDKIIYMKGLGYKDFENKIAVTPDTQFAIGSATKAFTALSVLMSQDEGKLSLDDSPKKYLPYFKMYDPETDKNITIRDLLSHSSGLNRTDLAMVTGRLTRSELIQVAAQSRPTAKLREKFQYQNIMFTAGGEIVSTVQKMPWEKFVPERIFKPLGMNNTSMSMKEMEKVADKSFGYNYNFDTKETEKLPYRDINEVAPAGSINSSARDMAQWLRFVLGGGSVDGKRLVSENSFAEWLKPQMKVNASGTTNYGLGWFLQKWNGMTVVQHGGNIDGFNSLVAMIPEKKLGFVMLTNVSASSLGGELMPIVWKNILGESSPEDNGKLSQKTMQFMAGKYRLEAAGVDMEVKIEGEDLVLTVPGQPAYKLQRFAPRQFKLAGAPEGFAVKFLPEQGDATEMYLQQPQGNYTLPRINADGSVAKSAPVSTEAARPLIGTYTSETSGKQAEIKDVDGKVSMVLAGQQPYALLEKSKDAFSLSPLPDTYWLKVVRDAGGKIEKIVAVQPEGEFGYKPAGGKPPIAVDELNAKVLQAAGGEANWKKLTSRVSTFDIDLENQGVKAFGTSYAKAPNKSATETTLTALGKTIATGFDFFDGTTGEEIYSFAPVEKYTGKRLEDVRLGADFYGVLDWKTKYKSIDVLSVAKCGEEECYAVTFTPEKGSKFTEYYSTKTFLLMKRDGVQVSSTSSVEIPFTVTYSDYRDVDGIKLPFKTSSFSVSNGNIVTHLKTVKHNVPVDDSIFKPRKLK
ncbi:MAG TPA: serine hydrolase [Pyrinomonadaceae bacterium]|nr:serine hydrolase [Pyrinomonadaceae bacterium]